MANHLVKKGVAIGILVLFVVMALTVSSAHIQTGNILVRNHQPTRVQGAISDTQEYLPYSVMNHLELTPESELTPKPAVLQDIPSSFSWLNYSGYDWTTPARNQGGCGSCWAFGAVSALESRINIAWGTPNLDVDLSEQYILSCLPAAGSCNGGNSFAAYKFIISEGPTGNYCNGIITESCLPYEADDTIPCSQKSPDWRSHLLPLTDCGCWNPHYPDDVNVIKSQIVNEGPVVTYFEATGDFMQWGSTHHNPTDYYPYVPSTSSNHAVAIVGYKDDPLISHGGYWIVKNSWGTGWGYNGFFNIEYGSLNIDNVQITWATYNPAPIVAFSSVPTDPSVGDTLHFTEASSPLLGTLLSWSWDLGDTATSQDRNPVHSYAANGTYNVTLTVTDSTGHSGSLTRKVFVGDDVPPTTISRLSGVPGGNGWFVGNSVIIHFIATDTFSGANYTMYNLDETGYVIYDGPIIMHANGNQGKHTIKYYSVDNVGNVEKEQSLTFGIDSEPPQLMIEKPKDGRVYVLNIGFPGHGGTTMIVGPLRSVVKATDSGSGIDRVEFFLNGDLVRIDTIPPYTLGINRLPTNADMVLLATAYDQAGWTTTVTTHFTFIGFFP
jgi:C1A family cysteine protease